ncbi:cell division ATP-binding protein FtsE [Desulfococcaceae bacterium HSG8]|nr:cell division ATP-binding protein FtsE [Desulfococcaceae bacterium HSG8]
MRSEFTDKHSVIRLFHVHKRYDAKNALIDISFDVTRNEFLFITGPSGAGKTTLMKLLYLGERASEGQIIIDGINLSRISRRRIPFLRRKFGIIFQDYKLIPTKTVFDNIALVVEAVGTKKRLIRKKVKSVLRTVGMEEKSGIFPQSLSGGEQQRVAVARAVAGNPSIILADEPTGSLDSESASVIFNLLKAFHKHGATVMIATHDTDLIRRTGGRVIILEQGRIQTSTVIPKLD